MLCESNDTLDESHAVDCCAEPLRQISDIRGELFCKKHRATTIRRQFPRSLHGIMGLLELQLVQMKARDYIGIDGCMVVIRGR